MKLILAQGNPGAEYHPTRHNVGFWLLDMFANAQSADWSEKSKFHTYLAEFSSGGEKVLIAKPLTYYNDTGLAARALIDFYKIKTSDVLVLHDDLMLPIGTIRTREKGSDAGNNGIKSLNAHLGPEFKRVRIGIWSSLAERTDATSFVLGKFTDHERQLLSETQPIVAQILDEFVAGKFQSTSYKITRADIDTVMP